MYSTCNKGHENSNEVSLLVRLIKSEGHLNYILAMNQTQKGARL